MTIEVVKHMHGIFTILTHLDLRADLNSFFEPSKRTESSNSLSANSLQFSQLPATTAAILQNTLSILPQLRDEHQRPREHLSQNPRDSN